MWHLTPLPCVSSRYLDQDAWNAAYTAAFHKMVNTYANFRNDRTNKQRPVLITGT